jgi:transcriptional regulator
MPRPGVDVLQGTLDMLVLKALAWGQMHGYSILAWLRQTTAALYPALHRMEARGLIEAEWGLSENNRKAKFYRLTARGRRELRAEAESWTRYVSVIGKIMAAGGQPV